MLELVNWTCVIIFLIIIKLLVCKELFSYNCDNRLLDREQVKPVPSGSTLSALTSPSSTSIEKRWVRTLPRGPERSFSRSIALVNAPFVSASMRTFPSAFWSFPHAAITKGSLTETQTISLMPLA